jgi:hypothetical protein
MNAVPAFYDFWNTGDEVLLGEALAPDFTDHTLPLGRPQGPQGPADRSTFSANSARRVVQSSSRSALNSEREGARPLISQRKQAAGARNKCSNVRRNLYGTQNYPPPLTSAFDP